jgi:hypothetical protein
MFGRLLEVKTRYKTRYKKAPIFAAFFDNPPKRHYIGVTPFFEVKALCGAGLTTFLLFCNACNAFFPKPSTNTEKLTFS